MFQKCVVGKCMYSTFKASIYWIVCCRSHPTVLLAGQSGMTGFQREISVIICSQETGQFRRDGNSIIGFLNQSFFVIKRLIWSLIDVIASIMVDLFQRSMRLIWSQLIFFKDQCERIHQDGSHSNFWNQRHSPGKLSKTCKHFFLSSIDRFWWSNWSRQSFSKIGVMDLITIKIK